MVVLIVLQSPDNFFVKQFLIFEFKVSNNQDVYKAFIFGMNFAVEMGASSLKAMNDSQLITNRVAKEYKAKEAQLIKYLISVRYF